MMLRVIVQKAICLTLVLLPWLSFGQAQLIIDDHDSGTPPYQQAYSTGAWINGTNNSDFYNGTYSYSNTTDATLTFTFQGVGIEWWAEKYYTHGVVSVSVDWEPEQLVDLYASKSQKAMAYANLDLFPGAHTITIRITGQKNPSSTNYFCVHDYFKVYLGDAILVSRQSAYAGGIGDHPNDESVGIGSFEAFFPRPGAQNVGLGNGAATSLYASAENVGIGYRALPEINLGATYGRNVGAGANVMTEMGVYIGCTALGSGSQIHISSPSFYGTAIGSGAVTTGNYQVRFGNAKVKRIGGQTMWSTLSDGRFKRKVKEDVPGVDFISKLRPVSYAVDREALSRFIGAKEMEPMAKNSGLRYTGFVAQDVDKVVKKTRGSFGAVRKPMGAGDVYTIRYEEFVVPLVKAVQQLSAQSDDLQEKLDAQQRDLNQMFFVLGVAGSLSGEGQSGTYLIQPRNAAPNLPLTIQAVIAQEAGEATVEIYDEQAVSVKSITIPNRGEWAMVISGGELSGGNYLVILRVDGEVVDTKLVSVSGQ